MPSLQEEILKSISGRLQIDNRSVSYMKGYHRGVKRQSKNYLGQALQFLREVKVELKKVTWPTRKQTIGSTAVVIVLVMIISLFLGLVDIGLSSLIRVILQ